MNEQAQAFLGKAQYGFADLVGIMAVLRGEGGCPWDRAVEAIDREDATLLREELGDVLLQVVFHARMEQEKGVFSIDDVCDGICRKLILRHPHIFGDVKATDSETVLTNWDEIKKREKGMKKQSESLMSVPAVLPALMRSQKLGQRAAKVGFDWQDAQGVLEKLQEELDELRDAVQHGDAAAQKEELGDLLFTASSMARFLKCDAEEALYAADEKFIARFCRMEKAAEAQGKKLAELDAQALDALWNAAKRQGE